MTVRLGEGQPRLSTAKIKEKDIGLHSRMWENRKRSGRLRITAQRRKLSLGGVHTIGTLGERERQKEELPAKGVSLTTRSKPGLRKESA